jgi:hypothetical protein
MHILLPLIPQTTVEYYSMHGVLIVGWLIGYASLGDPLIADAYVIDIEPRFDGDGYLLPAGKVVIIEADRVRQSPSLAFAKGETHGSKKRNTL